MTELARRQVLDLGGGDSLELGATWRTRDDVAARFDNCLAMLTGNTRRGLLCDETLDLISNPVEQTYGCGSG